MLPLEVANLLKEARSDGDTTAVIVPDDAHRPPVSVSESSWSEVPALCRHRGRHSARSLKKRTLESRWGGSEEGAASKQTIQEPQLCPVKEAATSNNSSQPRRKASMEMSNQDIDKFQRTRNLCKPMRKTSVDMSGAAPLNNPARQLPGLSKPMRKASMEMGATQDTNKIHRTRNLCKPMRKASVDMANVDRSQLPGLRKPTRKASMDMQVCDDELTSHRQGHLKEHRHNSAPLLGYAAAMDQSNSKGEDDYESSESSSSEGDGCMIDLIRAEMPRRSNWDNAHNTSEQEEDYGYTEIVSDDEFSVSTDEGGCMLDHVRSMPRRGICNKEVVAEQEDYGYTDHQPTRRVETDDEVNVSSHEAGFMLDHVLSMPRRGSWSNELVAEHEDYGYTDHQPTRRDEDQTEPVDEQEESESSGSDCMVNMAKNIEVNHCPQHQKPKGLSRPQRKASIDMCGGGNAVIDLIGMNALAMNQTSSTRRSRRASLNMGGVDMAQLHISTAPAVR